MNLLHIDSSVLGDLSASRELSRAVADALRAASPATHYRYRDLAVDPPPHLSGALLAQLRSSTGAARDAQPEVRLTDELLEEFMAADVIVLGAPMYNFSVSSALKAWIDRIAQAGRTFRYTPEGPVGLAGGKRVIVVSSRGTLIHGTAAETALDHQEAYLRTLFGFLGITAVEVLRAEGLGMGEDARRRALQQARGGLHAVVTAATAAPARSAA